MDCLQRLVEYGIESRTRAIWALHLRPAGKEAYLPPRSNAESPYENLIWSSESTHLYTVRNLYHDTHPDMPSSSDKAVYPGTGEGNIEDISVPGFTQRDITVISASDSVGRDDPQNQFLIKGLSKNGKNLSLYVEERRQERIHSRLLSIDIQSGASQIVLEGDGTQGVGWHEAPALPGP